MPTQTANLLQTLAAIITAGAAILAAYVAWNGLKTWQSQLMGKNEYEVARRLLESALKLEDVISSYRNPIITQGEINAALNKFGEENTDNQRNDELVYQRRWEGVSNIYRDFSVTGIEAKVLWGSDVEKKVEDINNSVQELWAQTRNYLIQTSPQHQIFFNKEAFDKSEKTLYKMTDDEFGTLLHDRIMTLEKFLRPKLTFQRPNSQQ